MRMSAQVIVTSYLFPGARFDQQRLESLSKRIGSDKLVVDVRRAVLSLMLPGLTWRGQLSTQRR
jgi:hypothetical protein